MVILLIVFIIVIAFCANIARKMIIFGKIEEKMSNYNNYKNYYVKVDDARGFIQEYFCMDNK